MYEVLETAGAAPTVVIEAAPRPASCHIPGCGVVTWLVGARRRIEEPVGVVQFTTVMSAGVRSLRVAVGRDGRHARSYRLRGRVVADITIARVSRGSENEAV